MITPCCVYFCIYTYIQSSHIYVYFFKRSVTQILNSNNKLDLPTESKAFGKNQTEEIKTKNCRAKRESDLSTRFYVVLNQRLESAWRPLGKTDSLVLLLEPSPPPLHKPLFSFYDSFTSEVILARKIMNLAPSVKA